MPPESRQPRESCRGKRGKRIVDGIFIAIWLCILFAGIGFKVSAKVAGWPDWDAYIFSENRRLTPKPNLRELPPKQWGKAIDAWYNDAFAWRSRLLQFNQYAHFKLLKSPVQQTVPGRGDWVFRRSFKGEGTWLELDDYLGAYEFTAGELQDWVDLFEGRVQWAEAHGITYLEVLTSVKAQVHPEKLPRATRIHKGVSAREQVEKALANSRAKDHVLFTHEMMTSAAKSREVFYHEDHHENAYGCHLIYAAIIEQLQKWLGPLEAVRFYDDPPQAVIDGKQMGCYEKDRKLVVQMPGETMRSRDVRLSIAPASPRYPMQSLAVHNPSGEDRSIIMAHDSFMRFPLHTWRTHLDGEKFMLPFGPGFRDVYSLMFRRYDTPTLEKLIAKDIPDVIIEQFPESKLNFDPVGLDDTMRNAAAFLRGAKVSSLDEIPQGKSATLMVQLADVRDDKGETGASVTADSRPSIAVEILSGHRVIATAKILPGPRRALFLPLSPATVASIAHPLAVRLTAGTCASSAISLAVHHR